MNATAELAIRRDELGLPTTYRAPDSQAEQAICAAFAEVFSLDRVGADDDFFDLGGDSLSAETLVLAVSAATGREFRISALVQHGSPAQLARLLSDEEPGAEAEVSALPVFCVHGKLGFMLPKPELLAGLGDRKLTMFELPGIRGDGETPRWIEDIAAAYIAEIYRSYPSGPILLAGFCSGCLIALEMAARLTADGREVKHLVLGDPTLPETTIRNMGLPASCLKRSAGRQGRAWPMRMLMMTLRFLVLGRWTDGTKDADFGDSRLRWLRERQARRTLARRRRLIVAQSKTRKFPQLEMSLHAQARLLTAYGHYRPRPFHGTASVVVSSRRRRLLPAWERLLPNAEIKFVDGNHSSAVSVAATLVGRS